MRNSEYKGGVKNVNLRVMKKFLIISIILNLAVVIAFAMIYNSFREEQGLRIEDNKTYAKNMMGFLDDFITFCWKLDEASSSSRCPREGVKYYTDMRNEIEQKYLK